MLCERSAMADSSAAAATKTDAAAAAGQKDAGAADATKVAPTDHEQLLANMQKLAEENKALREQNARTKELEKRLDARDKEDAKMQIQLAERQIRNNDAQAQRARERLAALLPAYGVKEKQAAAEARKTNKDTPLSALEELERADLEEQKQASAALDQMQKANASAEDIRKFGERREVYVQANAAHYQAVEALSTALTEHQTGKRARAIFDEQGWNPSGSKYAAAAAAGGGAAHPLRVESLEIDGRRGDFAACADADAEKMWGNLF